MNKSSDIAVTALKIISQGTTVIYFAEAFGDYAATYITPSIERQLGYTPEEFLSYPEFWANHIHPDDRERVLAGLSPLFETDHHIHEYRFQHKDGTYRWMHDELTLVRDDDDGSPLEIVGHWIDVTERKQAEEILCKSHEQLEKRVKDRTIALDEAKKEAERANAYKTRFLAAASHDLRQPLQAIGLCISVLSRQLDKPEQQEICGMTRKSLDTMGELLEALLDISKLESGSITPQKEDFPLQELLDRIVTDNLPRAKEKRLWLECADADYIVHSDPTLLERIIGNFVTNAIHYTDQGRVSLDCECSIDTVRIAVTDTGIGMPEDALEIVFNEYYQLDNPMRDRGRGLGLGLSIVKHIARLLGHQIGVSSELGEGSTFTIEVPLRKSIEQPIEAHATTKALQSSDGNLVVLFVDDDPEIVKAMKMFMESSGVEVYSALNCNDALAHIEAGIRPDILITDYWLPGCSGLEVISHVRRITVDVLPTILLTGDISAQEIQAARLPNCRVLHKPVDTDQLISLIDNLVAH